MKKDIIVTTGDLNKEYSIIGPIYFQVSNKGILSNTLSELVKYYKGEIDKLKKNEIIGLDKIDWSFLYGEWSVGQNDFDKAFYVSVQELKKRAKILNADAIICMRQDIDLDTNGFQYFYLQMYGTAVKFKNENDIQYIEGEEVKIDLSKFEICPKCHKESEKRFNICEHCRNLKH